MFVKHRRIIRAGASTLTYSVIPWDSEYLNNTTVEIENFNTPSSKNLELLIWRLERSLKLTKGDLIVARLPLSEYQKVPLLHRYGFYVIEQTITLEINLSKWDPERFHFQTDQPYQLIPALVSDKKTIRRIARTTFIADRFHLDPDIPKASADRRFEMWIENSFHSDDSLYKFINNKGTIIAFFIYRAHPDHAEFRLAGLDPKYIGHGLGKMLYHHMYRALKEKKYTKILSVISLNNLPVLNVYMYLGNAKFIEPIITLHKVHFLA